MFLWLGLTFAALTYLWTTEVRAAARHASGGAKAHQIHHLMSIVLVLKTGTLLAESARYHYIDRVGLTEVWSAVYFTFLFLKGVGLFIVILLIGSGWSFVRPTLDPREKKIVAVVLLLQVVDNVALVVMDHASAGTLAYVGWRRVLHVVDIVCCCTILLPIVWQIKALENSVDDSATDARLLRKLVLFRRFYCTVVSYIYVTRIVVYMVASVLDYRHTWVSYALEEGATLAFYANTGRLFRPGADNPYFEAGGSRGDDGEDEDRDGDERPGGSKEMVSLMGAGGMASSPVGEGKSFAMEANDV